MVWPASTVAGAITTWPVPPRSDNLHGFAVAHLPTRITFGACRRAARRPSESCQSPNQFPRLTVRFCARGHTPMGSPGDTCTAISLFNFINHRRQGGGTVPVAPVTRTRHSFPMNLVRTAAISSVDAGNRSPAAAEPLRGAPPGKGVDPETHILAEPIRGSQEPERTRSPRAAAPLIMFRAKPRLEGGEGLTSGLTSTGSMIPAASTCRAYVIMFEIGEWSWAPAWCRSIVDVGFS